MNYGNNGKPELHTIDVNSKKTPHAATSNPDRYDREEEDEVRPRKQSSSSGNHKKKKKKKSKLATSTKWVIAICIVIVLVFIVALTVYLYIKSKYGKLNYQATRTTYNINYTLPEEESDELESHEDETSDYIDVDELIAGWTDNDPCTFFYSEGIASADYVTNILLIGTDVRGSDEYNPGNADTNILVSINKKTKKIYLTSFMRDLYVYIPEVERCGKLNSAHLIGDAELLMDTIEGNFKVEIDQYARVNFYSLIDIIDAAGGIDMYVSEAEAKVLNYTYIWWMCYEAEPQIPNPESYYLTEWDKTVHLTGMQAVAYARIRYVGNADYERTERQRNVIKALADNCRNMSLLELNSFADSVLPLVTTNIEESQIWELIGMTPDILANYEIVSQRVPFDDTSTPANMPNGADVLVPDYATNATMLLQTIYGEE